MSSELGAIQSISNKNLPKVSNAKFKVIEVTPKFLIKQNLYEISGEIHQTSKDPRKVQIQEVLNDLQLERFIPGALLPCLLEGDGNALKVLFN